MNNSTNKELQTDRDVPSIMPPVDVIEDASGITLYADLPGVSKDKLNVRVEADSLTIEGELALNLDQGMEARYVEIQVPHFKRSFTLGKELDPEKVAAEFRDGVLKLHVPKTERAKPRRIEVQVA